MAYPHTFWKITFGGELETTDEIWSCGFHVAAGTSDVTASLQPANESTELMAIWDALETFHTAAVNSVPGKMKLRWVKIATIGKDGRYLQAPSEYLSEYGISGSHTGSFIPSTAVVYTLAANKFKDPGKYSRFYLPTAPPSQNGAFKELSVQSQDRADSAVVLIDAVNAVFLGLNSAYKVRAVSQRVSDYLDIKKVRVGNVIDTQRRRRNGLYETYKEADVS